MKKGEDKATENEHGEGVGESEVSYIATYADIYNRLSFWQVFLM